MPLGPRPCGGKTRGSCTWSTDCILRDDLRGTVALEGKQCTRAGWGSNVEGVIEGVLHSVPLICMLSLKLTCREVVFLLPLRHFGWGCDCCVAGLGST